MKGKERIGGTFGGLVKGMLQGVRCPGSKERTSVTGERYSWGKGAPGERYAGDTANVAPFGKRRLHR